MTLKLKNLIAVFLLTQLWSAFVISSAVLVENPSTTSVTNGVDSNNKPGSDSSPNPVSTTKESPSDPQAKLTPSSGKVSQDTAQDTSSRATATDESQLFNSQHKISEPSTSVAGANLKDKNITPDSSVTTKKNSSNSMQANQGTGLDSLFLNLMIKLFHDLGDTLKSQYNRQNIELILTQTSDILINTIRTSWQNLQLPLPGDLPDLNEVRKQILQKMLDVLDGIIKTLTENKVTSNQTPGINLIDPLKVFPLQLPGFNLKRSPTISNTDSNNSYAQDIQNYLDSLKTASQSVVDKYSGKIKAPFNQINALELMQQFFLNSMKSVLDCLNQNKNFTDLIPLIVENVNNTILKIPEYISQLNTVK